MYGCLIVLRRVHVCVPFLDLCSLGSNRFKQDTWAWSRGTHIGVYWGKIGARALFLIPLAGPC